MVFLMLQMQVLLIIPHESDDVVYLGRGSFDTSNRQFNGLLNSFELIKGRNLYSANFTPPVAPTEDPTTHGELSVSSDASR